MGILTHLLAHIRAVLEVVLAQGRTVHHVLLHASGGLHIGIRVVQQVSHAVRLQLVHVRLVHADRQARNLLHHTAAIAVALANHLHHIQVVQEQHAAPHQLTHAQVLLHKEPIVALEHAVVELAVIRIQIQHVK